MVVASLIEWQFDEKGSPKWEDCFALVPELDEAEAEPDPAPGGGVIMDLASTLRNTGQFI